MEKWVVAAKRADFARIASTFGIDPVTARLIRNRDIVGDEAIRQYLYGTREDLRDPLAMKDVKPAVEILGKKIEAGISASSAIMTLTVSCPLISYTRAFWDWAPGQITPFLTESWTATESMSI